MIRRLAAAACLALAACAGRPAAPRSDFAVELLVRTPEQQVERYRVDGEGTLSFAGGADALKERFTWSRGLSEDEIASLRRLIVESDLRQGAVRGPGAPADLRYEMRFDGSGGRWRTIRGACPETAALRDLLAGFARDRHAGFLERLPLGGPPRTGP